MKKAGRPSKLSGAEWRELANMVRGSYPSKWRFLKTPKIVWQGWHVASLCLYKFDTAITVRTAQRFLIELREGMWMD